MTCISMKLYMISYLITILITNNDKWVIKRLKNYNKKLDHKNEI